MSATSATPTVKKPASADTTSAASRRAIRVIAFVEALKGAVVLLAATGLLALLHRDLNELGIRLVEHTHLNPAAKYPHIFLDAMSHLDQPRLLWLAAGALLYAMVRLAEAYGLFWQRAWAEWLAALSGGVYVPIELIELIRRPSAFGLAVLLINMAVVAVMVLALLQRLRPARVESAAS